MEWLSRPIDSYAWDKIQNGKECEVNSFENMLYRLCWSFLFNEIGTGNTVLTEQRRKAFKTKEFTEMIIGIPIIAVLIFSMLDYSFREEAINEYKDLVKKYKG